MIITSIIIENFKGIREPVQVELKPITLLFGPNSAGKSTIIQALHYAHEIFERQNLDPGRTLIGGNTIDLGGFENLVHRHDKSLPIIIRFNLNLENESLPQYIPEDTYDRYRYESEAPYRDIPSRVQSALVEVSIEWSSFRNQPLIKRYMVWVNHGILAEISTSDDGRQIFLSKFNPFNPVFIGESNTEDVVSIFKKLLDADSDLTDKEREQYGTIFWRLVDLFKDDDTGVPGITKPISLLGQSSALPEWGEPLFIDDNEWRHDTLAEYEIQQDFTTLLSILIVGPGEIIRNALRKLCYLGPLRVIPPRNFVPERTPDASRWSNGTAAWDILFNEEDIFREKVNRWLSDKERFNAGYRVIVKKYKELDIANPITVAIMRDSYLDEEASVSRHIMNLPTFRRLLLLEEANNIEVQPLDIGVGISQMLPVIVAALAAKTGFVVIEQPELHIHPAFQVVLGDLFVEQIHEYLDLTFILETHSEHLMLRLLRRIRETSELKEAADLAIEQPEDTKSLGNKALTPADLSIYFIEQGATGITCTPIRIDQDGDFIDHWPHGFFDERAEELF